MTIDDHILKRIVKNNLYHYRKKRKFSQAKISEISGISLRSYQMLENEDSNPCISALLQIANSLEIEPSLLLKLHFLELKENFDIFLEKFKNEFESVPYLASIRTTEGLIIWVNNAICKLHGGEIKLPFDLLSFYKSNLPEHYSILKNQLAAEKSGDYRPYLSSSFVSPGAYRVYPILVYAKNSKIPLWSGIYSDVATQHSYAHFCDFSSRILKITEN